MTDCLGKPETEFTECLARQFARRKWEEYMNGRILLKLALGFGPTFRKYYEDEMKILNAENEMKILLDPPPRPPFKALW